MPKYTILKLYWIIFIFDLKTNNFANNKNSKNNTKFVILPTHIITKI